MAGSDTDRNVILSDLGYEAHRIAEALKRPKFWWNGGKTYINVDTIAAIWQGSDGWTIDVNGQEFILTEAQKESLLKFLRDTGRM